MEDETKKGQANKRKPAIARGLFMMINDATDGTERADRINGN